MTPTDLKVVFSYWSSQSHMLCIKCSKILFLSRSMFVDLAHIRYNKKTWISVMFDPKIGVIVSKKSIFSPNNTK